MLVHRVLSFFNEESQAQKALDFLHILSLIDKRTGKELRLLDSYLFLNHHHTLLLLMYQGAHPDTDRALDWR